MENLGYRKLIVYQKANNLTIKIYRITKNYPKDELFGLTSQMRRCAVSVVANIVEGYGRRTYKEKTNFYYISRGSLTELEYYLDLSLELKYLSIEKFKELNIIRSEVGRLLNGLIKSSEK